ncbi:hypothetical protein D3C72_1342230 [compost metagenome]
MKIQRRKQEQGLRQMGSSLIGIERGFECLKPLENGNPRPCVYFSDKVEDA